MVSAINSIKQASKFLFLGDDLMIFPKSFSKPAFYDEGKHLPSSSSYKPKDADGSSFLFPFCQLGEDTFNRAKLLNVGYTEALKDAEYDCFIFSDVDLIPMDDRNLYHCYDQPRHFAIAMDKFGFR